MTLFMLLKKNYPFTLLICSFNSYLTINCMLDQHMKYVNPKITPQSPCMMLDFYDTTSEDNKKWNYPDLSHCTLTISPDQKNLIIGQNGKVYQTTFDIISRNTTQNTIIAHQLNNQATNFSPLIAVTNKEHDNNLLVASAMNYYNKESSHYNVEIITYENGTYTIKEFPWAIQAMKFSSNGKLLIIANTSSVMVFNIENNSVVSTDFGPAYKGNVILDLAINRTGKHIIIAGQNGTLQLTKITSHNELKSLQKHTCKKMHLEKISFPTESTVLCSIHDQLTNRSQVNTGQIFDLFNDKEQSEPCSFSYSRKHPKMSLDTAWKVATAHWTKNEESDEKTRHTIQVYRNNDQQEEILLLAPTVMDRYCKTSITGTLEEHNEIFLNVALHDTTVAALTNSGKIIIWRLPENDQELQKKIDVLKSFDIDNTQQQNIPRTTVTQLLNKRSHERHRTPRHLHSQTTTTSTTSASDIYRKLTHSTESSSSANKQ